MGVFELYRDAHGKFRFRILDDDGDIVAISEAHDDKASAIEATRTTRDSAATSRVVDRCRAQPEDLTVGDGGYFLG
ncbi:DUF1508 domain-containing protein [Arthrobacter deserti]|uniref:DUF1508 domain-containing protein n=1 Tax=Arthrobacter deserti TaxID=1742687 RepID=A0ABX1JP48_9MICC|nr:DUF1508 domain-containing protein [Arthrobacter deserti]